MSDYRSQAEFGPLFARQCKELERVRGATAEAIRGFAASVGKDEWHMEDLYRFVRAITSVAPASCDRILRSMRAELPYKVLNRSKSLYRFE